MFTERQNLIETIRGGSPDRFVNQYEYLELLITPISAGVFGDLAPGKTAQSSWGYYSTFPEGMPGPMPLHDKEHVLLHDIEEWKEIIVAPDPHGYTDEDWKPFEDAAAAVNRDKVFAGIFVAPGLFELTHCEMSKIYFT